jgi:hypothetical protein
MFNVINGLFFSFFSIQNEKNGIEDKLSPLQFSVTHHLPPESEPSRCATCVQLLQANRALNASLPFQTGCRRDGVCVALIRLTPSIRPLPVRADEPPADDSRAGLSTAPIKSLVLGLHRALRVRLQIENDGDNAYQSQLRLTCLPPLPLQQVESHCVGGEPRSGELLCSVGNPFEKGEQEFSFTFDLTREALAAHQQLRFKFELSTSSNVTNASSLSAELVVPIKRFASIDYKR